MMKLASHAPVDAAADQVYCVTFVFTFDQSMKTGKAQTLRQSFRLIAYKRKLLDKLLTAT